MLQVPLAFGVGLFLVLRNGLPRRNEADLEDLPEEIRNAIQFYYADQVDDVLKMALEDLPAATPAPEPVQSAQIELARGDATVCQK